MYEQNNIIMIIIILLYSHCISIKSLIKTTTSY